MEKYLPWQPRVSDLEQLPHGLLLWGQAGLGKLHFAEVLAKCLLCLTPLDDQTFCGHCRGCHLFQNGTHPDYHLLAAEEQGKAIKVNAVRESVQQLQQTGQLSSRRVVVIDTAEAMNVAAANSLLKTLEEPPAHVYLLLVSHHPSQLLATIRSRCQKLAFRPTNSYESVAWLQQFCEDKNVCEQALRDARGLPLVAKQLLEQSKSAIVEDIDSGLRQLVQQQVGVVSLAQRWSDYSLTDIVQQMMTWCYQQVRLQMTQQSAATVTTLSLSALIDYYQFLLSQQRQLKLGIAFNNSLFVEGLLCQFGNRG